MRQFFIVCFALLFVAGCKSTAHGTPAVLIEDTDAAREMIRDALRGELGQGRIEFGPGDLTAQSHLTILPPPVVDPVTASPDMPERFSIFLIEDQCELIREQTGDRIPVPDLSCRPLSAADPSAAP